MLLLVVKHGHESTVSVWLDYGAETDSAAIWAAEHGSRSMVKSSSAGEFLFTQKAGGCIGVEWREHSCLSHEKRLQSFSKYTGTSTLSILV